MVHILSNGSGRRKACQASAQDKGKQPLHLVRRPGPLVGGRPGQLVGGRPGQLVGPPTRTTHWWTTRTRRRRLVGGQLRRLPKKNKCLDLGVSDYCVSGRLGYCVSGRLGYCVSGRLGYCVSGRLGYCVSGRLGYCDSGSLGYCDSGCLDYSDSGVGTIVNSGSWALAALWRYLCINSSFETNCILWERIPD